jgi:hypothetical protein
MKRLQFMFKQVVLVTHCFGDFTVGWEEKINVVTCLFKKLLSLKNQEIHNRVNIGLPLNPI